MALHLCCINFGGLSESTRADVERVSRIVRNPVVEDNPDVIPPI
jgi:hypothetical protein